MSPLPLLLFLFRLARAVGRERVFEGAREETGARDAGPPVAPSAGHAARRRRGRPHGRPPTPEVRTGRPPRPRGGPSPRDRSPARPPLSHRPSRAIDWSSRREAFAKDRVYPTARRTSSFFIPSFYAGLPRKPLGGSRVRRPSSTKSARRMRPPRPCLRRQLRRRRTSPRHAGVGRTTPPDCAATTMPCAAAVRWLPLHGRRVTLDALGCPPGVGLSDVPRRGPRPGNMDRFSNRRGRPRTRFPSREGSPVGVGDTEEVETSGGD